MLHLIQAESPQQLDQVRDLMRAFIAWHMVRHREDMALVNSYFDGGAFEDELASLPGKYGPPDGRLLLATLDDKPAGCVALRKIDPSTCEMKRMFVYERFHGQRIGLALAEAIIEEGRKAGYKRMLLDTGARQAEAQGLYHRLGFKDIGPYYDMPEDLAKWLRFMELDLTAAPVTCV